MLDYQDARKRRRVVIHRVVRIAIFVAAFVLALMVAWFYGMPKVVDAINYRRVINDIPLPGAVIYSISPATVRMSGDASTYQLKFRPGLDRIDPHRPWRTESSPLTPICILQCPGGAKRLIMVSPISQGGTSFFPTYEVHSPENALVPLSLADRGRAYLPLPDRIGVTIYAGRVDPSDSSHLIVDYDIDGNKCTIDGWLKPDDTMSFSIRSGPATTRPSQGFTAPPHPVTP
jgi:hypothetical protein